MPGALKAALSSNSYIKLRDRLGTVFEDQDFGSLFPSRGQPAFAPWRLALVTVMQFAEGLSDRDASDAVRTRIDWKYLLGLELTDPGFDYSILSRFRDRLIDGQAEMSLLQTLLEKWPREPFLVARGKWEVTEACVICGKTGAI